MMLARKVFELPSCEYYAIFRESSIFTLNYFTIETFLDKSEWIHRIEELEKRNEKYQAISAKPASVTKTVTVEINEDGSRP